MDSPAQESTTQPTASPRNQITLDQLREALQTRNVDVSTAQRELVLTTPSALDLLNTEALEPVLPHSRLTELLPSLMEHLPEQDRSVDRLIQVLRSPPVRVQAAALSNALQSGQASEILRSFGLPVGDGQSPYGMKAFLDALIEYQKQQNGEQ